MTPKLQKIREAMLDEIFGDFPRDLETSIKVTEFCEGFNAAVEYLEKHPEELQSVGPLVKALRFYARSSRINQGGFNSSLKDKIKINAALKLSKDDGERARKVLEILE